MMTVYPAWQPPSTPDEHPPWRVWEPFSPRFEHFSVHRHSGYEFFLHVRGGGVYQLGQQLFRLQPYQLLVIRPHQLHGPTSRQPLLNFERLLVQVSEEIMAQLHPGGVPMQALVEQCCQAAPAPVLLTPQEHLELSLLAGKLPPAETIASPMERAEALGYMSVLLSRFCQALTSAGRVEQTLGRDQLMQQIHDHVQARFMEDCSLEALAERFSVSKYHLSRRFSQTYGIGLHQYVLLCRMSCAQRLIRQGEPIMTVSYQCGFNDYSSFVRAFTRHTGLNPRAWRKQLLAEGRFAQVRQT